MLFSNFEKRKRNLKTDSRPLRREREMDILFSSFKRRNRILKTNSPNVFQNVSSNRFPTLVAFVCLFSTVCLQMSPQIACPRRCEITVNALFSTVHVQMLTQRAWIRAGKVTLVAFVRLFSTVCFQTNLQRAYLRGCKVTLVAFV